MAEPLTDKTLQDLEQGVPEILKIIPTIVPIALKFYREAVGAGADPKEALAVTTAYVKAISGFQQ